MNPDHFHREFYEDDNGTMPVLTWLNRLESDDMAKHDAIVYALQVILAREGAGVCGTEFGRTLGKGLYEFRLRQGRGRLSPPSEQGDRTSAGRAAGAPATTGIRAEGAAPWQWLPGEGAPRPTRGASAIRSQLPDVVACSTQGGGKALTCNPQRYVAYPISLLSGGL